MKKLPEFIIVADSETSGLDFEKDRIVTFFIGKMNQAGEWVEKHEWLLNPEMEIPEQASAVHGVSTEKAIAEGSDFAQGVIEIAGKLFDAPDYPLVFQNAPYDLTILDRNLRQIGVTNGIDNLINKVHVLDTLVADKWRDKYRKGPRKLVNMAAHYDIEVDDSLLHQASYDCYLAGQVCWKILDHWKGTVGGLAAALVPQKAEQAKSLEEYFAKSGKTNDDGTRIIINGEYPYQRKPLW